MKFQITLILIFCASLVIAQDNFNSSKIDDDEKKRLENQFKALKTFYINDDGLVVYQSQGDEVQIIEEYKEEEYTDNTVHEFVEEKSFTSDKAPIARRVRTEDSNTSQSGLSGQTNYSSSNSVSINKLPGKPSFTSNAYIAEENSKADDFLLDEANDPEEDIFAEEIIEEETKIDTSRNKRSIFRKEPSKYKDLEEAALAAQELLERLKTEQAEDSSKGSLSSNISRGAGKTSLRKKVPSDLSINMANSASSGRSRPVISTETRNAEQRYEEAKSSQQDGVPTYYLNGIEVDKSVIDKLKKSDITSKQVRTKNTTNSAGEIWYEVR